MQGEVGEVVTHTARLKTLHGGTLHMSAPLGFTLPGFDKDADPPIIERLMQFVTKAAIFGQGLGNELFLSGAKRRFFAGPVVMAMMVSGVFGMADILQAMVLTRPPSARRAAPLVADERGLAR